MSAPCVAVRSWVAALLVTGVQFLAAERVQAQLGSVINIPPAADIPDHSGIGTNTHLNLHPTGTIGRSFEVGAPAGTSTNVHLNVLGGIVGDELHANGGSMTNVSAGTVGHQAIAYQGSVVNVSGGQVGNDFAVLGGELNVSGGEMGSNLLLDTDSLVNISGGFVGPGLNAGQPTGSSSGVALNISGGYLRCDINVWGGSTTTITGGVLGLYFGSAGDSFNAQAFSFVEVFGGIVDFDFDTFQDADVHFYGSDFLLDGVPFAVGRATKTDLKPDQILEGVLADGTAFALGLPLSDEITNDTLTLHNVPLPPLGATNIVVPPDPAPPSIRDGQTLTLRPGGELPELFRAGRGSTLHVDGGTVKPEAQAIGADVVVSAGNLGSSFTTVDSNVQITGGSVASFFDAGRGTVVNMSGGRLGTYFAGSGSQTNISGGILSETFLAERGSEVNLSGGNLGSVFRASPGSKLNVHGGEFRLDGVLIQGLDTPGTSKSINVPEGSVFSGTLQDGTPFAMKRTTPSLLSDLISDGSLTLHATNLPAVGPQAINLPADPLPVGLRQGQKLTVHANAQLGNPQGKFSAGVGSTINVVGGFVGADLEAVGTTVNISDGILNGVSALAGSQVHVTGGWAGSFTIASGSTVNVDGGRVGSQEVFGGSQLNVSAGQVEGSGFIRPILAYDGSTVNISGGTITGPSLFVGGGAVANISGGRIDTPIQAIIDSQISLFGTSFLLDGREIDGLEAGVPLTVDDRDVMLTGTWDDGSPFQFELNSTLISGKDWFHPRGMLTLTLVDANRVTTGDFDGDGILSAGDIDLLTQALQASSADPAFDINDDGQINLDDHRHWVHGMAFAHTYFGDATLDGEFSSSDLTAVFQAGEYEDDILVNSTWAEGDWTADGDFDSSDLVAAFQDGGYEQGPRQAATAVPEPSLSIALLLAHLGLFARLRRARTA